MNMNDDGIKQKLMSHASSLQRNYNFKNLLIQNPLSPSLLQPASSFQASSSSSLFRPSSFLPPPSYHVPPSSSPTSSNFNPSKLPYSLAPPSSLPSPSLITPNNHNPFSFLPPPSSNPLTHPESEKEGNVDTLECERVLLTSYSGPFLFSKSRFFYSLRKAGGGGKWLKERAAAKRKELDIREGRQGKIGKVGMKGGEKEGIEGGEEVETEREGRGEEDRGGRRILKIGEEWREFGENLLDGKKACSYSDHPKNTLLPRELSNKAKTWSMQLKKREKLISTKSIFSHHIHSSTPSPYFLNSNRSSTSSNNSPPPSSYAPPSSYYPPPSSNYPNPPSSSPLPSSSYLPLPSSYLPPPSSYPPPSSSYSSTPSSSLPPPQPSSYPPPPSSYHPPLSPSPPPHSAYPTSLSPYLPPFFRPPPSFPLPSYHSRNFGNDELLSSINLIGKEISDRPLTSPSVFVDTPQCNHNMTSLRMLQNTYFTDGKKKRNKQGKTNEKSQESKIKREKKREEGNLEHKIWRKRDLIGENKGKERGKEGEEKDKEGGGKISEGGGAKEGRLKTFTKDEESYRKKRIFREIMHGLDKKGKEGIEKTKKFLRKTYELYQGKLKI